MKHPHHYMAATVLTVLISLPLGARDAKDISPVVIDGTRNHPAVWAISGAEDVPVPKLETSNGSGKASISYVLKHKDFGVGRNYKEKFSLTLSSPLQSGNKPTDFATLNGLVNAFTGTLSYSRVILHKGAYGDPRDICRNNPTSSVLATLRNGRDTIYGDDKIRQEIAAGLGLTLAAVPAKAPEGATCTQLVNDLEDASDEYQRTRAYSAYSLLFNAKFLQSRLLSFYGLGATLGYKEFKFLNPDKFVDRDTFGNADIKGSLEQEELPWSVSAHYGQVRRNGWVWKGKMRYERSFKETPSAIRCPGGDSIESIDCLSGAAGAPTRKNAVIASLEVKKFLSIFGGRSQAIALTTSYDFQDNIVGFDLPIYLLPDSKGNLNGGVRFGWRSDTKDPIIGIFVGAPISIF